MPKKQTWWEQQGYSREPGVPSLPAGEERLEEEHQEDESGSVLIPQTYAPARTSDQGRPRTLSAGYDPKTKTMQVKFREGAVYNYYQVEPGIWQQYKRSASPGKFINRRLAGSPYGRVQ